MKRTVNIILILLYLTMSSGVAVHYNYCRGKLTSVSVGYDTGCPRCSQRKQCCGKCGCCEKEVRIVKADIDQAAAERQQAADDLTVTFLVDTAVYITDILIEKYSTFTTPAYSPPPDPGGRDICILYGSIII